MIPERYQVDKLLGEDLYFVYDKTHSRYVSGGISKDEAVKLANEMNQINS